MTQTPLRHRQMRETRARIADTALDLFTSQGYVETTIDQIAAESGISRRTIFRYFPTKEAMVFDHLSVGREFIIDHLEQRPLEEPILVSLHAVLRDLSERGYDRRLLEQIHAVLAINPRVAGEEFSTGFQAFQQNIDAVLESRSAGRYSPIEIQALSQMAEAWFLTAVRLFFKEGKHPLVYYFDKVVAACVESSASELAAVLPGSGTQKKAGSPPAGAKASGTHTRASARTGAGARLVRKRSN